MAKNSRMAQWAATLRAIQLLQLCSFIPDFDPTTRHAAAREGCICPCTPSQRRCANRVATDHSCCGLPAACPLTSRCCCSHHTSVGPFASYPPNGACVSLERGEAQAYKAEKKGCKTEPRWRLQPLGTAASVRDPLTNPLQYFVHHRPSLLLTTSDLQPGDPRTLPNRQLKPRRIYRILAANFELCLMRFFVRNGCRFFPTKF